MSHDNSLLLVSADQIGYGVNSTYESCITYAQCAAESVRLGTYQNISSASYRIAGRCGHVSRRTVPVSPDWRERGVRGGAGHRARAAEAVPIPVLRSEPAKQ